MIMEIKMNKASIAGYGVILFAIAFILIFALTNVALAQDDKSAVRDEKPVKKELKTQRFIDEDGDGFNDLLPDSDGDGIPDMIDPDFKGHAAAESLYMHRYMHGQTIEDERNQFQHMYQHGEPGQYGPNDSTGHGMHGGEGGGHHGGGHGMGSPGAQGGGQQGGSGNQSEQSRQDKSESSYQSRSGSSAPEARQDISQTAGQDADNSRGLDRGKVSDEQSRKPEVKKGSKNQGARGGKP